jgi:hypothetical protein
MQPVPINNAEGIIEAFWDPNLSDLAHYHFCPGEDVVAEITQTWWCSQLFWQNATQGKTIFTMQRDMDVSLTGYDAIRIRCGVPSSARFTLKARVDGREQVIVDNTTGEDRKWEYTGPVAGKRLERLTIACEAIEDGHGGGTLQWIGLVNQQIEQVRQSRKSPYTPDWPKLLLPRDHPVELSPTLGLLCSDEDLDKIRRNVTHPLFKPIIDRLRDKAREYLTAQPEQFVMESGAETNRHHRAHEIAKGTCDPANIAIVCGFVGLVDNDVEMLRISARAMLSMAHAEYWDECFAEHFPGSSFDHKSFTASDYSYACALGLDWAGSVLTESGRQIILEAISKKGISNINRDFMQDEYIFDCNQASVFSQGRIAGLLAMRSLWPRSESWLDLAERDLLESIHRVFNLTEDHGSLEGPSYGGATLLRALRAMAMLARYKNKTLQEIAPQSMIESSDYFFMFLSTAGQPGSFIPYGDGQNTFALDMVSLMSLTAHDDQRWENLRSAMIRGQMSCEKCLNANVPGLLTLILTDPPQNKGSVDIPEFCLLESTGMLQSCRQTSDGPIRLQLIGTAKKAGHVHQDKGSFVLEAFGEALALDRGMTNYGHPLSETLKSAWMHNVLTPAGDPHEQQELIAKHASLPTGRADEITLDAEINTTEIWINKPFKKHLRRIHSPEPTLFFIEDVVEYLEPRSSVFHLHTHWPILRDKDTVIIRGERSQLFVTPVWPMPEAACGEDLFDGSGERVNHLAMTSQPGKCYSLVTVLQVTKPGDEKQWHIEVSPQNTEMIVATQSETRYTFNRSAGNTPQ